MSIRYEFEANPVRPGASRAVLLPGDRPSFDAFLDQCEVPSPVGRADALAVVEMMASWIEHLAAFGRVVDFGPLGQTRLGMAGVFEPGAESIRADEWRLTIGWQVARRLRERVDRRAKKAGLGRRLQPNRCPHVATVVDLMSGTADVYSPAAGGAEVRAEQYIVVFPKTVQPHVHAALTGPQHVIIRRRTHPTQPESTQFTYDKALAPA